MNELIWFMKERRLWTYSNYRKTSKKRTIHSLVMKKSAWQLSKKPPLWRWKKWPDVIMTRSDQLLSRPIDCQRSGPRAALSWDSPFRLMMRTAMLTASSPCRLRKARSLSMRTSLISDLKRPVLTRCNFRDYLRLTCERRTLRDSWSQSSRSISIITAPRLHRWMTV